MTTVGETLRIADIVKPGPYRSNSVRISSALSKWIKGNWDKPFRLMVVLDGIRHVGDGFTFGRECLYVALRDVSAFLDGSKVASMLLFTSNEHPGWILECYKGIVAGVEEYEKRAALPTQGREALLHGNWDINHHE